MVQRMLLSSRSLRLAAAILLIHVTGMSLCAQTATSGDPPELLPPASKLAVPNSPPTVVHPLDAPQVVELTRSGLDERIIADLVRERGVARPLTVEDLLFLRRNSVSNEVIRAMQQTAPKAAVYAAPATIVRIDPLPPPQVIIRTAPSYYWGFGPPVYVGPHRYHPYHPGPHSRGSGRVSFGFSF